MKTGLRIFLNSAAFGVLIAIVYWIVARHPGGTLLLALMAVGMSFVAGFMLVAERHARLAGDDSTATFREHADDDLGIFTGKTVWPLAAAAAVAAIILGAIWSPFLAVVATLALLLVCWRLMRESDRV